MYDHDKTLKCDGIQAAGYQLVLTCQAQQRPQYNTECIFVTLEIHLTTLFSEIFCFGDFFYGTGQDMGTDTRTHGPTEYGQTDFSRKILF